MADLAVEVDDAFQLTDRAVKFPSAPVDHGDVVARDGFDGPVADRAVDGQGLLVVLQGPLTITQTVVHDTDVAQDGGLAGPVADLAGDG